jgi:hypothetical protein
LEAYKAALAEYLAVHLEYSDYQMEFFVEFKGQRGEDEEGIEEIPPFPLHALLGDGQVADARNRDCIKVQSMEWPVANPTYNPGWTPSRPYEETRKDFLERIAAAAVPPEVVAMCEAFAQGVDAYRRGTTSRMNQRRDADERRRLSQELGIPLPEPEEPSEK